MELSGTTDFYAVVRILKRGLRDATIADTVVSEMQSRTIAVHDRETRQLDPVMNNLPRGLADSLGKDWYLLPHSFKGDVRRLRGSFLTASTAVEYDVAARPRSPNFNDWGEEARYFSGADARTS